MAIKKFFLATMLLSSVSAYGADGFVVRDIKVEGLQRVTLGAALLKIPVRVGDTVENKDISDTIRALYSSGNFEDVKVLRDGDVLVVQVKERPTISSVSFSGNKAIKDEQLTQNLEASGIKVGEALDRTTLGNIEKGLEDFYYSVGKYNATVKAVVTPLPRNRADLKFVFTEGVSAKIQQINFIGNKVFSDEELLAKFDLDANVSWWNFLTSDKYQKQVLAGDLEKLKSFYLDRGYLKFQITSTQVSISPDKKGVYITLGIDEGKPYTVKDVSFRGDLIGEDAKFKQLNPFHEGDIYKGSLVTGLEDGAKKILGEAGYAYPNVRTIPEFDDENQQVSLVVNVDPGKRIYVHNIRFEGNTVTKDEVLRREMRQMEGAWLNSKAIETSKTRLNRLGFFETVDVKTVRVPGSDDQVDLVYNVKEANSGSINFGIGYGTESGLSFQVGLQQDNFAGTGNSVGISTTINDYSKNVTLSYTDPYWNLDGVSLGGKVFYNIYEAGDDGIVDYTNDSYGASLTWGFPYDELNRFALGVGYTHNGIGNLSPYMQIEKFLRSQGIDFNSSEVDFTTDDFDINLTWTRNNLNRGYFPTAGNYQRAYYKMTVPGSDTQWFKMQYDVRQYYPLTKSEDFTVLLRGRLGYGNGYGKTGDNDNLYPFYENFYAGGFSTLRGFSSNTAGPKAVYKSYADSNNGTLYGSDESAGGNATALASIELIVPTPFASEETQSQVRTSIFYDMASVWDTEFDYNSAGADYGNEYYYDYSDPTNYRSSVGAAVQWMSPMGPLVFAIAKPIKKYEGDDEEFFSFTIGRTF
ncbi:outer membrane protein assembly factor BamA [Vibrio sp.]|uniref:Outer membrane protein assembly factor BamA n=1 Tax=Vibrio viridaestus TaxID=2487322 RepID=A0A3N9TI42_9VIBR|nr:outer membrane protein assembly factor BamA [Vibrio viridaestus]MDC0609886.1 outer membrane protein assembly factor BamA [Vibrio sp.]RQW63947.1 outer membrane protein assembly factor BamA [Vibrio viridaestus]